MKTEPRPAPDKNWLRTKPSQNTGGAPAWARPLNIAGQLAVVFLASVLAAAGHHDFAVVLLLIWIAGLLTQAVNLLITINATEGPE